MGCIDMGHMSRGNVICARLYVNTKLHDLRVSTTSRGL